MRLGERLDVRLGAFDGRPLLVVVQAEQILYRRRLEFRWFRFDGLREIRGDRLRTYCALLRRRLRQFRLVLRIRTHGLSSCVVP